MRRTRQLIIGIILGVTSIAIAATYFDRPMIAYWGDVPRTTLWPGQTYFNDSDSTLWVGGSTSNPVKVGDASWTNVTTGVTTQLTLLDASTNAITLTFTNGVLQP